MPTDDRYQCISCNCWLPPEAYVPSRVAHHANGQMCKCCVNLAKRRRHQAALLARAKLRADHA